MKQLEKSEERDRNDLNFNAYLVSKIDTGQALTSEQQTYLINRVIDAANREF